LVLAGNGGNNSDPEEDGTLLRLIVGDDEREFVSLCQIRSLVYRFSRQIGGTQHLAESDARDTCTARNLSSSKDASANAKTQEYELKLYEVLTPDHRRRLLSMSAPPFSGGCVTSNRAKPVVVGVSAAKDRSEDERN